MRRFALLLALATVGVPAVALASTTRTDTVTGSVHKTGISGTSLVYKGTVHSKLFGTGKVTQKIGGVGLRGTFVIVYRRGTVRGTVTTHAKGAPDGGVDVTGTYTYASGTKLFKHVSGRGTFTSHAPKSLTSATFHEKGKITY
jgi:hypothetical protein